MKRQMYFIMFGLIQAPTKAIFRNHYTHDEPTQHGTARFTRCVIFICAKLPAVSSLGAEVSLRSHPSLSGNMHFSAPLSELCHLSSKYRMKFLLSFLSNRCTGRKMISPAGSRFMVTFSSGFESSAPCSFLLNMIL